MNIPRSEHPKPQFERENWINLNGKWNFEKDLGVVGIEREYYKRDDFSENIIVPFCPESSLSGIGFTDFMGAVWYQREISVPKEWMDGNIFLHFGAVDYEAHIYINKEEVFVHKGGYSSFKVNIVDYLKDGVNTLTVCAIDDTRSTLQPTGKQSDRADSYGCFYTRTTGIWQTVWLEYTPKSYIKYIKIYPNPEDVSVSIKANVCGNEELKVKALYNGKEVGEAKAKVDNNVACIDLKLSEKHVWDLGDGQLYDLELSFGEDKVKSYFGLRSVRMDGNKFLLNGRTVFQRTVLDQGYYPDGIYTAPSDEILKRDIKLSMDAGFNGARLHEKVFEERFLYHCDKAGYMVWGEYPNWGVDISNKETLFSILPEWMETIERDFNHPAIIGWCPYNETWAYDGRWQDDRNIKIVYEMTKQYDKTRPCIDVSGNFHVISDIYDVHNYEQDVDKFKGYYDKFTETGELFDAAVLNYPTCPWHEYNGEPVFISEYGGIRWSKDNSSNEAWGYGNTPESEEAFIKRYKGLTDALLDNEKIMGFCYTQLYDVEQEQNGLYTYDRKPKFDINIFKEINVRKAKIEE